MNEKLIKNRIVEELIKAEQIWKQVEPEFMLEKAERSSNFSGASVPTKIPGFSFLIDGKPQVADFIAFVLDIRNSSDHLLQAISEKTEGQPVGESSVRNNGRLYSGGYDY